MFFEPVPWSIQVEGCPVHEFKCTAQGCKATVCCYLDTKDAGLTGNLRRHTRSCWGEQRMFGGQGDLDYSAPRVRWLCTLLHGKAKAQGTRPSKSEKKGTCLIGNSRGITVQVGRLLLSSGKALDTFLCPLHESGLVEGERT